MSDKDEAIKADQEQREAAAAAPEQAEPEPDPGKWAFDYHLPAAGDFKGFEYLPAPELEQQVQKLIAECDEFDHLRSASIAVLWKKRGTSDRGRPTVGLTFRPDAFGEFMAAQALEDEIDFVITIAADHARKYGQLRMTALLFHELCHCGRSKKGEYRLRGHDFSGFAAEISRFGAWDAGLRDVVAALQGRLV